MSFRDPRLSGLAQQQAMQGALGGLGGLLGQQSIDNRTYEIEERMRQITDMHMRNAVMGIGYDPKLEREDLERYFVDKTEKKPQTIIEELQSEVDDWLKDTI